MHKCSESWLTYGGADDEPIWSFPFGKWQPLFLLQAKHDNWEGEHKGLARASEGNTNHVSTGKSVEENKGANEALAAVGTNRAAKAAFGCISQGGGELNCHCLADYENTGNPQFTTTIEPDSSVAKRVSC